MAVTDEGVFASMQREIRYESCLRSARSHLASTDYDRAIAAVREARRFLAPGVSPAELDAIAGAAQSARDRAERDRREREARIEAKRKQEREDRERAVRDADERAEQIRIAHQEEVEFWEAVGLWAAVVVGALIGVALLIQWLGSGLLVAIVIGLVLLLLLED